MSQVYEMPCEVGDLLISSDDDDTGYLVVGMNRDLMLKLLELSKENEGTGWSTFLHMDLVKSYLERGIWRKV